MEQNLPRTKITIQELYPDLSDDQLKEVEETLQHYAAIAWRVCERLEREKADGFDGGKDPS